jgi:hypothetical protein
MMTRAEHIAWCKSRAIQELEFSKDPKQGVISMMSDLGKHPETANNVLRSLCMMMLMGSCTERSVREFINGFN